MTIFVRIEEDRQIKNPADGHKNRERDRARYENTVETIHSTKSPRDRYLMWYLSVAETWLLIPAGS